MTTCSPELHVFNGVDILFKSKHDNFISHYLGDCIMGGDALNHTSISDVSFIQKDKINASLCSRILNSIIHSNPLITVHNQTITESEIILDIFYINNYEDIEDFYCLKTIYDFMVEGVMLYQIFEVNIKSLNSINDFWLTR